MMSTSLLLYRPRLFTHRKVGIIPPEKYMVIMNSVMKKRFPGTVFFDSTYPAGTVTSRFSRVPITV